jgi:signal transduction histidine kinase
MEKVDVMDLLERALFFIKKKSGDKNVNVRFELEGERVCTKADANRLMQVFLNIMINSVEAIKGNGKVQINVKKIKKRDLKNPFIIVKFTDNGSGINPSIITKIFDPFFTTKT